MATGLRKNSAEFAWSDITISYMGLVIERIVAIEYDIEEDKKYIYGRGKKVKGVQPGNEKPTWNMTIGQSVLESMVRQAQSVNPLAKVTDLTFDIQVTYMDILGGDLVVDRIIGAEITKAPKGMKQGDSDMEVKCDGMCMDILYNVKG